MQLARRLPSQLDALRDAYERGRAALLEGGRVAQEVFALARRGRPLDARRLVHRLRDAEGLPDQADYGNLRPYQPTRRAQRVRRDALHSRHQLGVVPEIAEELARPLGARPPLHLFVESSPDRKHKSREPCAVNLDRLSRRASPFAPRVLKTAAILTRPRGLSQT